MVSPFEPPDWVQHAIFYEIFPDRFAASKLVPKPRNLEAWNATPTIHGYKGGDLLGVMERLDYLQDLGITAIYFTPIFRSACNHRYHTHDYFEVDPLLGGNAAFRTLLREAHRRRIRIVLDGVFNHASRGFFQFNDILENGPLSPYLDWFDVKDFPLNAYDGTPNYRCWADLPALPEFNHQNPDVRKYIYSVARYWLNEGIDGWRLDVPFCINDDSFWQGFRDVVKQSNPDAYITGEIPWDATRWLQGDQFDGVMNYLFTYCCWGFFGGAALDWDLVGHWWTHGPDLFKTDAANFAANTEELLTKYPRPFALAQLNLLDSHDTARFLSLVRGDKRLLRLATLFQMTYPGAPCIFYGDEIGLSGGKDPLCRQSFPWEENPWEETRWDHSLLNFFKRMIQLRKAHPALRSGEFKTLYAQGEVLVYLRQTNGERFIIVINRSQSPYLLDIPVPNTLAEGSLWHDQFSQGAARVVKGRLTGLSLPSLSGAVLMA